MQRLALLRDDDRAETAEVERTAAASYPVASTPGHSLEVAETEAREEPRQDFKLDVPTNSQTVPMDRRPTGPATGGDIP
eukprot:scaffold207383_cov39-Prasinocladus_malaysianus.AAC.1